MNISIMQPSAPQNMLLPRWLKLRDAARYSAIGENRLIKMAQSGQIKGFQDSDTKTREWIFDRFSLDEYRENQAPVIITPEQKALEIMNRFKI